MQSPGIESGYRVEWNHHSGQDDWSVGPKIRLACLDAKLACQKGYAALYRIAVTLGLVPLHRVELQSRGTESMHRVGVQSRGIESSCRVEVQSRCTESRCRVEPQSRGTESMYRVGV